MRFIMSNGKWMALTLVLLGTAFGNTDSTVIAAQKVDQAKPGSEVTTAKANLDLTSLDVIAKVMAIEEAPSEQKLGKEAQVTRKLARKERLRHSILQGEERREKMRAEMAARKNARQSRSSESVEENRKKSEQAKLEEGAAKDKSTTQGR